VGHLRAECHRTGVRDIAITGTSARLAPIELRTSASMRLRRLARDAIYKEDLKQLVVPLKRGVDPATQLVQLLTELVTD
jgi:transcription-repair coupling factor (superfamily II helicase)